VRVARIACDGELRERRSGREGTRGAASAPAAAPGGGLFPCLLGCGGGGDLTGAPGADRERGGLPGVATVAAVAHPAARRRRYGSVRREEHKDGSASEQGDTPRVKVVERPPSEMPIETPRSSKPFHNSEEITMILIGLCREEELVSVNLGLSASLVLLLSMSAVELNKIVELRAQMEALVSEMEEKHSAPAFNSHSQESNGSSATTTAVKDPIAFPAADAASNCSRTTDTGRVGVVIDSRMEAELSRLQRAATPGTLGCGRIALALLLGALSRSTSTPCKCVHVRVIKLNAC
jgi:hypothetical protein